MEYKAALFDLDNTLMDRDATFGIYCDRVIARYMEGASAEEKVKAKAFLIEADEGGYGGRENVYNGFIERWGVCTTEDLFREWYSMPRECYVPMAGLYAFLAAMAKRCPIGVVTNGSEITQTNKMDALGLRGYFQTVLISGACAMAKPDARIFHLACEQLNVAPEEVVFVGDHWVNDIEGAQNAGLRPIWLCKQPPVDCQVETAATLPDVAAVLGIQM